MSSSRRFIHSSWLQPHPQSPLKFTAKYSTNRGVFCDMTVNFCLCFTISGIKQYVCHNLSQKKYSNDENEVCHIVKYSTICGVFCSMYQGICRTLFEFARALETRLHPLNYDVLCCKIFHAPYQGCYMYMFCGLN